MSVTLGESGSRGRQGHRETQQRLHTATGSAFLSPPASGMITATRPLLHTTRVYTDISTVSIIVILIIVGWMKQDLI